MRSPLSRLSLSLPLALVVSTAGLLGLGAPAPSQTEASPQQQPQRVRPLEIWLQVYAQLPELPREDQYESRETGQIVPSSTLISRFIRYHTFIKNRSPIYRLDWKLTLADYLGVNERMSAAAYPGADSLRTNPLQGDRTAIQQLNRVQRDQLVNVLVSLFMPSPTPSETLPSSPGVSPPTPEPSATPASPRPGDARLLQ